MLFHLKSVWYNNFKERLYRDKTSLSGEVHYEDRVSHGAMCGRSETTKKLSPCAAMSDGIRPNER